MLKDVHNLKGKSLFAPMLKKKEDLQY